MTNLVRSGIYGVDSGAVMAASVFMAIRLYDQNGLVPRWSYQAASTVFNKFKRFLALLIALVSIYIQIFTVLKLSLNEKYKKKYKKSIYAFCVFVNESFSTVNI